MINSNLINDSIGGTYLSDSINLTSINQAFANISKNTREKPTLDFPAIGVGLFLSVFILFAILGNILVILSVQCNKNLQTVTNLFVINLAVADLLLSIVVLPFSASLEVLGCWIFGRSFCNVWAAVDVLCCTASILSLCVISIDRYIGVKYSLQYPTIMTKKKARVILVVVWISSMVVSIGPLLGWKEPPPLDESICSITEEPGYALFSSLFSFYLPLTVTMVMYFRIYVIARRTTKSIEAGVKSCGNKSMEVVLRIHCRNVLGEAAASNKSKSRPFRSSLSVRLMKFSREKKAAKTLAIVVGVFVLCWLPFFFVLPLCSLFPTLKPSEMVFKVIFWLGYFNSCVNPIIYPCSSKEFKRAFIQLLRGQCRHRTRTRWRWRASVNSSKQDAVRNYRPGFSNPESITLNDSFLQKGQCETLSFQSWGFLTPLQKPSLNLKEKINNLSEKIKNGPGLNSAYALSQTTIDSVSMRISDDCADQRSYGTHDLTEYYALKETDISNDTFSLDIYNV